VKDCISAAKDRRRTDSGDEGQAVSGEWDSGGGEVDE